MKRRGALLIEATIAVGLVAMAMIAVAQLLAISAQQERRIEQRHVAAQEAANALETALVRTWEDLTSERLSEIALPAAATSRLADGQLRLNVDLLDEQPVAKKLIAEVSWKSPTGERDLVRLCAWKFQLETQP